MATRRLVFSLVGLLALALFGVAFLYQSGLVYYVDPPNPDSYERVTVTAYDDDGTELATVEARVADSRAKRWLGLSDTERLEPGQGMLFVHESEGEYGYVMRDMSFQIDIVFISADERVTAIHHAPVPEGDADREYSGRAKWVLEVPRGWANRTDLDSGDRVAVPAAAENASSCDS